MSSSSWGSLSGLALAFVSVSFAWPQARAYLKHWTHVQALKFVLAILLCVAFAMLWIPLADQLMPRNAAGEASPAAAAGAVLGIMGWIILGVLLLTRYCLRYLPTPPNAPKPPKWLTNFGVADLVRIVTVTAGLGLILVTRYA